MAGFYGLSPYSSGPPFLVAFHRKGTSSLITSPGSWLFIGGSYLTYMSSWNTSGGT